MVLWTQKKSAFGFPAYLGLPQWVQSSDHSYLHHRWSHNDFIHARKASCEKSRAEWCDAFLLRIWCEHTIIFWCDYSWNNVVWIIDYFNYNVSILIESSKISWFILFISTKIICLFSVNEWIWHDKILTKFKIFSFEDKNYNLKEKLSESLKGSLGILER